MMHLEASYSELCPVNSRGFPRCRSVDGGSVQTATPSLPVVISRDLVEHQALDVDDLLILWFQQLSIWSLFLTASRRRISEFIQQLLENKPQPRYNEKLSAWHCLRSAIMSLDPPPYLNSLQNNIRARPIPWEGAVRAGNITDDQLKKIKSVDKVRKDKRKHTIDKDLHGFSTLLVGSKDGKSVLEHAAKRSDIVQYILVLAADMINGMVFVSCLRSTY